MAIARSRGRVADTREIGRAQPPATTDVGTLAHAAARCIACEPRVLVCLGATATAAVPGSTARVMRDRGAVLRSEFAERAIVTVHPSAILRAPDDDAHRAEYDRLVADLGLVAVEARVRPSNVSGREP